MTTGENMAASIIGEQCLDLVNIYALRCLVVCEHY
jgi:hypothetical protein